MAFRTNRVTASSASEPMIPATRPLVDEVPRKFIATMFVVWGLPGPVRAKVKVPFASMPSTNFLGMSAFSSRLSEMG